MTYRTAFIDIDSRLTVEHEAPSLDAAIDILRQSCFVKKDAGLDVVRDMMRWWSVELQTPFRLWGALPGGGWLSLDHEDVLDAIQSPEGIASFEAGITPPDGSLPCLIYRLRMTSPNGSNTITDHSDVRSIFETISQTWDYHPPLEPGFTHWLWHTEAEPYDFALSARTGSSPVAVPLPLARADVALASNHDALSLEVELRQALTRGL